MSKLIELWKKEKENQKLQFFSKEDLEEIEEEFRKLREKSHKIGKSEIAKEIISKEKEIANKVLDNLLFIRSMKAMFEQLSASEVILSSADTPIIAVVSEARRNYKELLQNIRSGTTKKMIETRLLTNNFETILIKKNIEKFVDEWGKEHGPYEQGEIAFLPRKYAEILIKNGNVERILD